MQLKPFFINSNICLKQDDILTYEKFMKTIAGNTGNAYITYALIKELFGNLVNIDHIPNIYEYNFDNTEEDTDYINNNCTHVFLILQDQIRIAESYGLQLPYEKIMAFIKRLNKPVIIAGLGANSFNGFDNEFHKKLNPNLLYFLKFLSDHCIEIGVRGHFTEDVLNNIGIKNVNAIGCPSYFEQGEFRVINKKAILDSKSILLSQYGCFENSNLHAILQDMQEENIIKLIAYNRFTGVFNETFSQNIFNQKYHIYSNIDEWKEFVKQFRFTIGYRLHGTILSLNSGVPAMCLNGDSRATEMCNLLKIPHNPNIRINTVDDILEIYNHLDYTDLNSSYPKLYNNFVNFLHKNNVEIFNKNNTGYEYISQPSLNLYSKDVFATLENNNYYISERNREINTLVQQNNNLKENINTLIYEKIKILLKEHQDIINEIYSVSLYLKRTKFFQQLFSIKNENAHKVLRILGIKIKFRRRKCL